MPFDHEVWEPIMSQRTKKRPVRRMSRQTAAYRRFNDRLEKAQQAHKDVLTELAREEYNVGS